MNIAICDNSKKDACLLHSFLKSYLLQNVLPANIFLFSDSSAFLESLHCRNYQVVFISSHTSSHNGFSVLRLLRKNCPDCIGIICASGTCTVSECFDPNAFGYLLKPLKRKDVFDLMERFVSLFPLEFASLQLVVNRLTVSIPMKDILYVEVLGRTCSVWLYDHGAQLNYRTNTPLYKLEHQLNPSCFLKTHKSFIVNMNFVTGIVECCFRLADQTLIPINIKHQTEIKQRFFNYCGQSFIAVPFAQV